MLKFLERCELMHEVFLLDIDIDLADVTRQFLRLTVTEFSLCKEILSP
jgi:hypothetical protein